MPDETTPAVVATDMPQAQTPTPAQPAASAMPASEPATPAWVKELDTADPQIVRRHPRVAAIVGELVAKAISQEKTRIQQEEGTRAARATEERLRALAKSDPVSFAEQWLSDDARAVIQRQLDEVKGRTRSEFAGLIGRGYQALPDWGELTPEEHTKLVQAVAGKADDEVVPAYNAAALELLAERRAQKRLAEWKQKELAREREAIRSEEAAKLLAKGQAPDLGRGKQPPAFDPSKLSDKEFDRWYQENVLSRR